MRTGFGVLFVVSLLLVGCGGKKAAKQGQTAGGISWAPPESWTPAHDLPMRVATYTVPRAEGDVEPGECGVFYFGKDQGGSVDMNIERWGSQFMGESMVEKTTTVINDLDVVIVRIAGTYLSPAGPSQISQGQKADYKLLGAIVEAPEGRVFFKCTGPGKTIEQAEGPFMEMMNSLAANDRRSAS
ncbi:MAG: hypothetical protein HYW57_05145 [Ignavibacteriales bacterium]|nr:hypothetical protein [Ignavibacteriales bacterium]